MTTPLELETAIHEAARDLRARQEYVTVCDIVMYLLSPDERPGAAGCEDFDELVDAVRAFLEEADHVRD